MTKINFITKPKLFLIGQTRLNVQGIDDFAEFIEMESGKHPVKLDNITHDTLHGGLSDLDAISEIAGRVCYQSYFAGRDHEPYIDHIKEDAHGNVFEHAWVNTIITGVSRSLTHELIRHRVGTAISEMSQRFVGANEKSGQWNFVVPAALRHLWPEDAALRESFRVSVQEQINIYNSELERLETIIPDDDPHKRKRIREAAREHLPNSVETRAVWSFNMRQVRHILDKRGSEWADRQIADFSVELLNLLEQLDTLVMNDVTTDGKTVNVLHKGV